MKSSIPNLFTAANLFCGLMATLFVIQNEILLALIMTIVSLAMDFMDGFVARMLKVSSEVGKQLDSLADMVSFGVVPGFIMALLIGKSLIPDFLPSKIVFDQLFPWYLTAFLIPVFSALRLARFNLDERQSDAFYGLPTPANTMLIFSFWLIVYYQPNHWMAQALDNKWILTGLALLSCWLLIANVRLLALKFKNYSLADNWKRYLLIVGAVGLFGLFQFVGIPLLILLYLLLSIWDNALAPVSA